MGVASRLSNILDRCHSSKVSEKDKSQR